MIRRTTVAMIWGLILQACVLDDTISDNQPPVAHAGADQQLEYAGAPVRVRLDARRSSDPDGTVVAYRWLSGDASADAGALGRAGQLDPQDMARPSFELEQGTYELTLWVQDDAGDWSAPDTVTVRVGTDAVAECMAESSTAAAASCTSCACAIDDACRAAVVACDDACWALIQCAAASCEDPADLACVAQRCADLLGAAVPAMAVAPCALQCQAECGPAAEN